MLNYWRKLTQKQRKELKDKAKALFRSEIIERRAMREYDQNNPDHERP